MPFKEALRTVLLFIARKLMCTFHCNVSKNKYSAYLQPIIETGSGILSESKPMLYCFLASDLFRSLLFVRDRRHKRVTTLQSQLQDYGCVTCNRTFGRPLHWAATSLLQWKIWCHTPLISIILLMTVGATLLDIHLILWPNISQTSMGYIGGLTNEVVLYYQGPL